MFLQKLSLTNFKNHEAGLYRFTESINCIVGENGSGKTNLLDAIYFLALTKSAISNQDALSIHQNEDFMMIDGVFCIENIVDGLPKTKDIQITCSLQRGQRKAVLRDKKQYEKLSEHIGKYPVVLIAPNDTDIIRGGSEERRKFFDGVLAQLSVNYLTNLLQYNRLLDQRNSLLKQFAERNYIDHDLLDVYSAPMLEVALKLNAQRRAFASEYLPIFKKHYANLSESRESVEIFYESEVSSADFPQEFVAARQRDVAAQRSTKGIHKDDFVFEIKGAALRKFGSQGQQKSFLIALKLAQFEMLFQQKQTRPLLLLDDVFDKLDDRRIQKLILMMADGTFGQVFLTDARPERTKQLLEHLDKEVKFFEI